MSSNPIYLLVLRLTKKNRKIYDDQFVNRLRILHDIDTGAIRLQASIYQGEMKRTPVWTAFINKEVRSRSWARLSREPDVVILRDLDRKIFTHSDYIPLKTQTGEHILKFASRRGECLHLYCLPSIPQF